MNSTESIIIATLIVDNFIDPYIGILRILTIVYFFCNVLLHFLIDHRLRNSDKERVGSI